MEKRKRKRRMSYSKNNPPCAYSFKLINNAIGGDGHVADADANDFRNKHIEIFKAILNSISRNESCIFDENGI